ncbi:MAG: hypothetical protein GXP46_13255 [Deferribacteres bacterium]|nr:hypothetical protein [Deferribacteres bacterium]
MRKFLPLLVLYFAVVLALGSNSLWADESHYVMFATNLSHGYYSPRDDVNLWYGPGYPLVLLPFVLLNLPWLAAKLLNPLFLFMAVVYFHRTLRLYMRERQSLFFSYALGLYYPFLRYIYYLMTETLAVFLVCGFIFHFCKLYHDGKRSSRLHLPAASFYLGYLALTKVFFGYVIMTGLLLFLCLYLLYLWKKKDMIRKSLAVYLLALFFCTPYLLYTYSLTGKIFYWGDSGGMSLYWMSTPYENELGDWQWMGSMLEHPDVYKKQMEFDRRLSKLPRVQRDEAYKRQAVKNIVNHPLKYFKNWLANIGRLLFNYPYSYTSQKVSTYFYIIPNMFLVVFGVACIYPACLRRRLIPGEIYGVIGFGLIAFGGSSLLSAYNRQFWPLVPVVILWIAIVSTRVVRIELRQ